MINKLNYKGTFINIKDEGKGIPVVLLHGYIESLDIWQPFSDSLKEKYRIIRIDIPGHGQSAIIDKMHTMEMMAEVVRFVLDALFIDKCVLIGHSMGGYVTLAFADHYPERLLSFCLFHSHPLADNEEKKQNREREINLTRSGKKDLIFNINVPKGFANENLNRLKDEIVRAKNIARKTSEEGIIAILEGMKNRSDRTAVIKNSKVSLLWILGKKDNYILFEDMKTKVDMNEHGELFVLENSGHMGFLEEPDISIKKTSSFINLCES